MGDAVPNMGMRAQAVVDKTAAELDALARAGVQVVGNAFSSVLLLKGAPGQGECDGSPVLMGADGRALRSSLLALGYAPEDWAGLAGWHEDGTPLDVDELRLSVATLDPATVVACDDAAGEMLCAAWEIPAAQPGWLLRVAGLRMLFLGAFEDALADAGLKQVMWARLKQIPPLGEPY